MSIKGQKRKCRYFPWKGYLETWHAAQCTDTYRCRVADFYDRFKSI